jgi:ubiquinone/menaquinone biosynthesis C-methylase UbiE
LSSNKHNETHLIHDITKPIPLPNNSVDVYLSEDVFEHLDYNSLPTIINEIYRVLKPSGVLRLAMPDYRCDILANRSIKDKTGNIIFDPQGGGSFVNGKIIGGGHLWFPYYETTKALLQQTDFFKRGQINFLHYYNQKNKSITNQIDYDVCYVRRTPDHDGRVSKPYRAMSIVVDLIK